MTMTDIHDSITPLVLEDAEALGLVRVSNDLFVRPKDVVGVKVLKGGPSWNEEVTVYMRDGQRHVIKDSISMVMGYLAGKDRWSHARAYGIKVDPS